MDSVSFLVVFIRTELSVKSKLLDILTSNNKLTSFYINKRKRNYNAVIIEKLQL